MIRLNELFPKAVRNTKKNVLQDMKQFLMTRNTLPSFSEYFKDRDIYLNYIWHHTWTNYATRKTRKEDKVKFLENHGYAVEDLNKKLINRLFRDEVATYKTFDVKGWLLEEYSENEDKWRELYQNARTVFLLELEAERLERKKIEILDKIDQLSREYMEDERLFLFLYCRSLIAKHLYESVEQEQIREFLSTVSKLQLDEFDWYKNWDDERDSFYILIYKALTKRITAAVNEKLPAAIHREYEELFYEPLMPSRIGRMIEGDLDEFIDDIYEELLEEQVSDLLEVAEIPFEFHLHKRLYEKDHFEKIKRREEALEELRRKKAEEERMINEIFGREYSSTPDQRTRYILHIGETNTGKTYHALKRLMKAKSGIYLAPLRLLALEVYEKLNHAGVPCTLRTGEEEKIIADARHMASTVEMFSEKDYYEVAVIDEAQMLADRERGFSWYRAITGANASEVHIIGSFNVKNMLLRLLGDADIHVHEYKREIPLQVEKKPFKMKNTRKGDALVCFSRKKY